MNHPEWPGAAATEAPRLDLYAPIHKALRAMMADALVTLGQTDGVDEPALDDALGRVGALLSLCTGHVQHEDEFMHTAMQARAPGAADCADGHHAEHRQALGELHGLVQCVRAAQPAHRYPAIMRLYRALAVFIGENLVHMHMEETDHNAVLWSHYTDGELGALHDRLVQSIEPQEMAVVLRWMIPALSPMERVGMLADMRAKMPPGAFEGVLELARGHLPPPAWAQLSRGLALAPVH